MLLEDVPGTAKTVLARAIARSVDGASASRIQCTPDLQPTDVTGLSVYNQKEREFEFQPGPVFTNILLVDEINRAMPKTQSALLEAMAERQITVDGESQAASLAVPDPRDREPTRPRGRVPAPRGAARPLLPQGLARLPAARRGARDRAGAASRAPARLADSGGHPRPTSASCTRGRGRLHRPHAPALGDRSRACHARASGRAHRRVGPRLARARARCTRDGAAPRQGPRQPVDIEHLVEPGALAPPAARPLLRRSTATTSDETSLLERCLEQAPRPALTRVDPDDDARPTRRHGVPADPVAREAAARGRGSHESPPRKRRRDRELATVSARRRDQARRLGRLGAAFDGARHRRVRRPRPLRRGRRPRRDRRRPEPVDGAVPRVAAVAAQAGRSSGGGRDDRRQRSRGKRPARATPRRADGPLVDRPRRDPVVRRAIERACVRVQRTGRPTASTGRSSCSCGSTACGPAGTFVFVISDFLPPPSAESMRVAVATGWDLVPVVVQDPVWERSFPDVSGVTLPLADPKDSTVALVRLSRDRGAGAVRRTSCGWRGFDEALFELGLDAVTLTAIDPEAVHAAFLDWAERSAALGPGLSVSSGGSRSRSRGARRPPVRAVGLRRRSSSPPRSRRFARRMLLREPTRCSRCAKDPITIKRALSTIAALFGDRSTPRSTSYTDDRSIDPGSVQLRPNFSPYRAVRHASSGRAATACRSSARDHARVPDAACLPPRERQPRVRSAPLRSRIGTTGGRRAPRCRGARPGSFTAPGDPARAASVSSTPRRRSQHGLRRSPTLAAHAADRSPPLALGLVGAVLLAEGLWPRLVLRAPPPARLTPLERSLPQVEAAALVDDEPQRRAGARPGWRHTSAELRLTCARAATRSLAWGAATPEPERARRFRRSRSGRASNGADAPMIVGCRPAAAAAPAVDRSAIPSVDTRELGPRPRAERGSPLVALRAALDRGRAAALVPRRDATAERPAALRGRRRADGRDRRLLQHAGLLGHDRASRCSSLANDPAQRAGLVLASQSAYVALPPETPGSALRGWQRMISYINAAEPQARGRARSSTGRRSRTRRRRLPLGRGLHRRDASCPPGSRSAIQALRESGTRHGQIVLISDLRDAPEDLPRVSALISRMHELGHPAPGRHGRQRIARSEGVLRPRRRRSSSSTRPTRCTRPNTSRRCRTSPRPSRSCCSACALAGLLALAELLVPLRWRSRRGPRMRRRASAARRGRTAPARARRRRGLPRARRRRGSRRVPRTHRRLATRTAETPGRHARRRPARRRDRCSASTRAARCFAPTRTTAPGSPTSSRARSYPQTQARYEAIASSGDSVVLDGHRSGKRRRRPRVRSSPTARPAPDSSAARRRARDRRLPAGRARGHRRTPPPSSTSRSCSEPQLERREGRRRGPRHRHAEPRQRQQNPRGPSVPAPVEGAGY